MRLFRAKPEDVPRIEECARMCCAEHGENAIGGHLNWDHYRSVLLGIIESGIGAMFLVEDENGKIVAGIAGAKYPAVLTGVMRTNQIFVYVQPEHRGKVSFRKLVGELEAWAVENSCRDIVMPLIDSMPMKTRDFYEHSGYNLMQTEYRKSFERSTA